MVYLLMAFVQISYVTINAIRTVLMIKGRKVMASVLSTFEIFIYILGLSLVLDQTDSAVGLAVYSLSYGAGILLGVYIEQKIAFGYVTLQIISDSGVELAPKLRGSGYGVTSWYGEGAQGPRMVYIVLARRKNYAKLNKLIRQIDPKAFIISSEPSHFVGGYWTKKTG